MRIYRAAALHCGATARNSDTHEQVISQPDLPPSTTGAERNGLVRDTANEVQFVCAERAKRSESTVERDINLGTTGLGRAGAPVIGIHVDVEEARAASSLIKAGAGTGAGTDSQTPVSSSSFLSEDRPCASADIDLSLSAHPLRMLSKSANELRLEVAQRVGGPSGGVGRVAGDVDEEGMSPVRAGSLRATGHG